jgi:hypothetical protein
MRLVREAQNEKNLARGRLAALTGGALLAK